MNILAQIILSGLVGIVIFCAGVFIGYGFAHSREWCAGWYARDGWEKKRRNFDGRFRKVEP
jgi:hypothetical protein